MIEGAAIARQPYAGGGGRLGGEGGGGGEGNGGAGGGEGGGEGGGKGGGGGASPLAVGPLATSRRDGFVRQTVLGTGTARVTGSANRVQTEYLLTEACWYATHSLFCKQIVWHC